MLYFAFKIFPFLAIELYLKFILIEWTVLCEISANDGLLVGVWRSDACLCCAFLLLLLMLNFSKIALSEAF